ncbi:glycoside hydrolase family 43 protein [Undibacterium danionis]|uniref:Glycoside hydrolase 43 family protein n=1 Tax=Undibacterium danionis TaxID=1812100 RepID=A0ABV6IJK2_9BURK
MMDKVLPCLFLSLLLPALSDAAQTNGQAVSPALSNTQKTVWEPDLGNGRYRNPIIHADYSDPDVIRVGDQYYMTASSFNSAPGLPLLQSSDMIHWSLVGHALPNLVPAEMFSTPQHGKGVWAPSLRFHDGKFWIFYPDPDVGIYVMTAKNFAGPWSSPHLLIAGKGLIDPTPLWDDDGKAWLLHAWAKSRAGFNNQLSLKSMSSDASQILEDKGVVIDGNQLAGYTTLEGPKFYKHNGWYYVFAPAGGVEHGWQTVFRAKNILGPYEEKIVLAQGNSSTNGPHQGAWVTAQDGSDWFYHFQDKRAYGRIVHLQPMTWENDWPVMGVKNAKTGIGEPVAEWRKPLGNALAAAVSKATPAESDNFSQPQLGLQWQWNANWKAEWYSLSAHKNHLRLYPQTLVESNSLIDYPAIILQKIPAPEFDVSVKINLNTNTDGDRAGLILYGLNYAWLGIQRHQSHYELRYTTCTGAGKCQEKVLEQKPISSSELHFKLSMRAGGIAQFYYSENADPSAKDFTAIGAPFVAAQGRWVGAKIGLFSTTPAAIATTASNKNNYADFSKFMIKAAD